MAKDDYAVLVGVTRYPHLEDLKGPENDALAIEEWLTDPSGGAVPKKHVAVVTSSQFANNGDDPEPNQTHVYKRFEALIEEGRKRDPKPVGRRLYIFMAGHGAANPSDYYDTVLLMANAKAGAMGHYVAGRPVASYFSSAAYFQQIVLFMDCCRDSLPRAPLSALPWDTVSNPRGAQVEHCFGFATRWSRKARERDFGDQEGSRGVFTRSVLEGLRAGCATPRELQDFVEHRMPKLVGKGAYQKPEFMASDPDMALIDGASTNLPRLLVKFSRPDPNVTVTVRDGRLSEIGTQAMDGPPWELELRPGLYLLERSDRDDPVTVNLTGDLDVEL
jgi:uncharacterized caspase-like protein